MSTLPTTFEELLEAIGGNDSSGTVISNPSTDETVGYVHVKNLNDLNKVVEDSQKAQKEWAKLPHSERVDYLNKAADAYRSNRRTSSSAPFTGAGQTTQRPQCSLRSRRLRGLATRHSSD